MRKRRWRRPPAVRLPRGRAAAPSASKPIPLLEAPTESERRLRTGIGEFDRVLGGGLVPGSGVLIGGEPGVGKSTLLMQAASALADSTGAVLYTSGEESVAQLKRRADRIGASVEAAVSAG